MGAVRHLSAADVTACLPPMAEALEIVEQALRAEGQSTAPAALEFRGEAFELRLSGRGGATTLTGDPARRAKSQPYLDGELRLLDPGTGALRAVLAAGPLATRRAACCAAAAARHLADPRGEVITIVGCGAQGRANIEALLLVLRNTERMLCFDTDFTRQEKFADEVMTTFDLASIIPPEPQEAVVGAHVLVTSIPLCARPEPVIEAGWLQKGTLCIAQDLGTSFQPQVFGSADRLLADDTASFAALQAGGALASPKAPEGELSAVVAGRAPGRGAGQPTIACVHLGLADVDAALGAAVLARAEATGRGELR